MHISKKFIIHFAVFMLVMLAGTAARAAQDTIPYYHLSSITFCILIVVWISFLKNRLLGTATQTVLEVMAFLMVAFILAGSTFDDLRLVNSPAERALMYLCYVFTVAISSCSYLAADRTVVYDNTPINRSELVVLLWGFVLSLLILTNDAHELVFRFSSGRPINGLTFSFGLGFYFIAGWVLILFVETIRIMYSKMSTGINALYYIIPLLPLLFAVAASVVHLGNIREVYDKNATIYTEFFCFTCIGTWEIMMVLGLLPTNGDYEAIFNNSTVTMQISDSSLKPVYLSASSRLMGKRTLQEAVKESYHIDENVVFKGTPINNGYIFWKEDSSMMARQKKQLEEIGRIIAEKNAILTAHNEANERRARAEEKKLLSERINEETEYLVGKIEGLIALAERDKDNAEKNIILAGIYQACLKRKSNLLLLESKVRELALKELEISISEVMEFISFLGISTAVTSRGNASLPSENIVAAFNAFIDVADAGINGISSILVTCSAEGKEVVLKINESCEKKPPALNFLSDKRGNADRWEQPVYEEDILYLKYVTGERE